MTKANNAVTKVVKERCFYLGHQKTHLGHYRDDKRREYWQAIAMKQTFRNFTNVLTNRDEWLFIAVPVAVALLQLASDSWPNYLSLLMGNIVLIAPLIAIKYWQASLRQRLSSTMYWLVWSVVFVVYPLITVLNSPPEFWALPISYSAFLLLLCTLLESVLIASQYFKATNVKIPLLARIGLDELLLFFMAIVAVYAALLITSDLPMWYQSNSVETTVRFEQVIQHPGMLFSLAFQLFCLFFSGYIFYWINHHILIAHLLDKRGILVYLCSVVATVVLLYPPLIELYLLFPINHMAEPIIPAVEANAFDWANGRVYLAVMLLSFPVIVITQWHKKSNQVNLREKEHVQNELRLLKQQIDPHFFFNTLNNLYALCRKKSEQAPEVVLQLAELMQYVVYKGQQKHVHFCEEVDYIKDYINLQSIRLKNNLSLNIDEQIDNQHTQIPPLLLIILVENAFKHGIESAIENSFLTLNIQLKQNRLVFTCENSIEPDAPSLITQQPNTSKPATNGVGLANLTRRLQLLYPQQFQLTFEESEHSYKAQLIIEDCRIIDANAGEGEAK